MRLGLFIFYVFAAVFCIGFWIGVVRLVYRVVS